MAENQQQHSGAISSAVQEQYRAGRDSSSQQRKPGKSDSDRSLGSTEQQVHRHLKTTEQLAEDEKDVSGHYIMHSSSAFKRLCKQAYLSQDCSLPVTSAYVKIDIRIMLVAELRGSATR